jgi:hypothetical protein
MNLPVQQHRGFLPVLSPLLSVNEIDKIDSRRMSVKVGNLDVNFERFSKGSDLDVVCTSQEQEPG